MAFATRVDLLARSNARRLAQLSVPADMAMPPDDALRVAIAGGDLAGYTDNDRTALTAALDAIDKALGDADALIVSYGIPDTVQTTLLARLASTVALYYLQGAERMTKEVSEAYANAEAIFKKHAKGELSLSPEATPVPLLSEDMATIESRPSRYTTVAGTDW
jgi:phage gp36-like protein